MAETLYRRDSNGNIRYWSASPFTGGGTENVIIRHGSLGGKEIIEYINTNRAVEAEIASRYKTKIKQGYVTIADIKDNVQLPVKGEEIERFLQAYLPSVRTTGDGSILPMLAKAYDNTNNKLFKDCTNYIGQWKINGLRCFVRAVKDDTLFGEVKFTFQSREGTYWNSLNNLSEYLLVTLPKSVIDNMLYEGWILDGELYIPGFTVNDINHFVKDQTSMYNSFIQFWCYDIYIENTIQLNRQYYIDKYLDSFKLKEIFHKEDHLNIKNRFNVLPTYMIDYDNRAIAFRDKFINLGFEGLILRNPNLEYEAGKRKMIKYKRHTDGVFTIIDIIPDGIKRPDVGKIVCSNDINDAQFECHLSDTIDTQKEILRNKHTYIGEKLFIEYGERSGVNQVPFHIKHVRFK